MRRTASPCDEPRPAHREPRTRLDASSTDPHRAGVRPVARCFALHPLLAFAMVMFSAGCVGGAAPAPGPAPGLAPRLGAPLAGLGSPAVVGTIVVMGVELPVAGAIGSHYEGVQFEREVARIFMSDGLRRSWALESARRLADRLRDAGYRVEQGATPTSDARALGTARFGLTGRVASLRVRSSGGTGPHRIEASSVVAWELLDLARGASVIERVQPGRARAREAVDAAVLGSLDASLAALLGDTLFLRALAAPRPRNLDDLVAAFFAERPGPGSTDTIRLGAEERNPLGGGKTLHRLVAGLVTVSGNDREDTGVLITRDGLLLTTTRAAGARRAWARFGTGDQRPARFLRAAARAGIALMQVSCPDPCATVPWTLARGTGGTRVIVVGAPFGADSGYLVGRGSARGRAGRPLGARIGLDVEADLVGSEPVARDDDGRVFALTVPQRRGQAALPIAEVFRLLGIVADSTR